MNKQEFPPGWDESRVKNLLAHYEQMDDDDMIVEDEITQEMTGQTLMIIPTELVPLVRELIIRKTTA
jgi:hypothetical protein